MIVGPCQRQLGADAAVQRLVAEAVERELGALYDQLEDDLVKAVTLQDFWQLDRLVVVWPPVVMHVPPAVASLL